MSNSEVLRFFEQVYGEVPEWVQKMDHFSPQALEYYTKLRSAIMTDGAISKKHKELILVGINAARRYERSMLYHTKGAIDSGATIAEIADVLSVCVISRGIPAWLTGVNALQFAETYAADNEDVYRSKELFNSFGTVEECDDYYVNETGKVPLWVQLLKKANSQALIQYSNLRTAVLSDHVVSRKLKEFILIGINVAERYKEGVKIHVNGAKKQGATDQEIAEVSLVALLTAGIPAWFEGSDFLEI